MVILSLQIIVPPGKRAEIKELVSSFLEPTQASSGCLSCRSYQDTEKDDSLILIEEWKSEGDLGKHIRSDEFKVILALMDLSGEPPEIKIHTVSQTTGMDAVMKTRSRE